MIDPVLGFVGKGVGNIVFDIAKKVGGSVFEVVKDKRQAAQAAKTYADKYKNRYGVLKLLGMSEGVSLESVYTPVRFLDDLSIRRFESIEALEDDYRQSEKRRFKMGKRISQNGIIVASDNPLLMVLGSPGAGKSTFLRRVGLEAFKGEKGKFKHSCVPVFLELKRFNTEQVNLIDDIVKEFENFGFPSSKEFAIKALEEGKLLVLLDGLDEVPKDNRNEVIESIEALVIKYDKNRFITSCRTAAYPSGFTNFRDIELADFDDNQIKYFINNWFQSDLDKQLKTADKCWELLDDSTNKAAKELAHTPLLLTFLCLVYNRKQSFPNNRSRLYNKALDILLEEWAAEKRIKQKEVYEGLNTDLEKVLLAQVAYDNFAEDRLFFPEQQLVTRIKDFLADTVDNPKYLDGKAVLKTIAIEQGILVERAEEIYSFSHLTLQEYLTAQYISQEDSRIEELINKHLTDSRWREVFLLIAGLKDNADKFLKQIEKATQDYVNTPLLQGLLAWAEQIIDTSTTDIKPVGKRAIACTFAVGYAYAAADAAANGAANAAANAAADATRAATSAATRAAADAAANAAANAGYRYPYNVTRSLS